MTKTMEACRVAAQSLAQLKAKEIKPVPDGWFTVEQYSEENDVCKNTARFKVAELLKHKLVEQKDWPLGDALGRITKQKIYRPI